MLDLDDRARLAGLLLGGALGDALGRQYEGVPAAQIPDAMEHLLGQQLAGYSDDTQLTLATCEALIEADGVVRPEVLAALFLRWFRQRRLTGLGASTTKALRDLDVGAHWASGYVADSVPLALFAVSMLDVAPDHPSNLAGSRKFFPLMCQIVRCGGDTDTNASIFGQVVGSLIGPHGLPVQLLGQDPSAAYRAAASQLADLLER